MTRNAGKNRLLHHPFYTVKRVMWETVLYCKTGDVGDGFFCYRIQVYINKMFTDEEDGKGGTKE